MSVAGISTSSFYSGLGSANIHSKFLQLQQEFKLLGNDLKSGSLSQAQSDFATLQQELQQQQSASPTAHHHHRGAETQLSGLNQQSDVASLFSELGQDLQSGNVSQAQQTYASLQQDFQQFAASAASSGTGRISVSV